MASCRQANRNRKQIYISIVVAVILYFCHAMFLNM